MSKLVKISSHRKGKVAFTFDNGVRLSVVFDAMTYSDNYDLWNTEANKVDPVESTTVEIWQTTGNHALNRWIGRKYGEYGDDQPIGYVPVEHLPAILKRAGSNVYAPKPTANNKENNND